MPAPDRSLSPPLDSQIARVAVFQFARSVRNRFRVGIAVLLCSELSINFYFFCHLPKVTSVSFFNSISGIMLRFGSRSLNRALFRQSSKGFAAEAAPVELPKAVDTPGKYATALYHAAKKTNSLDAVVSDVSRMQEMQVSNSTLSEFLENPSLPRNAKIDTIGKIVSKSDFSPTFSQFLLVMAENGRTAESAKTLESFQNIIATLKGEVVVKVTTTIPLSEWELSLLKKKIKQRFFAEKPNAELTVETAIDEDLIGGLTIQVGDRFMDLSTRTELRKLQEVIMKSVG